MRKVTFKRAEGAYSSAGADEPLLLCSRLHNLVASLPSRNFSAGRLHASAQAPSAVLKSIQFRGGKPAGPRHRDEEVHGRPRPLESPPEGDGRAALEVLTYWLGPEGFLPEEKSHFLTSPIRTAGVAFESP